MWQLKGRLERRLGKGDEYNSPDQFGPTKKRIKEWILGDYRFRVAAMQQCAQLTKQSHKEWVGGSGWRQRSTFSLSIACLGWVLFAQVMLLPLYMHAQDPCAKFLPKKNLLNVLGLWNWLSIQFATFKNKIGATSM